MRWGNEGRADGGRTVCPVRVRPNRIQTWKKALAHGAAVIFDCGNGTNEDKGRKSRNNVALAARLCQQTGQFQVERDFL